MQGLKLVAFLLAGTTLGLGTGRAASHDVALGRGAGTLPTHSVVDRGDLSADGSKVEHGQAARPMAHAEAERKSVASANDVVLIDGETTIRIKRIEIAGSSLNDGDVAAFFAAKTPAELEARLRTLDAASILIPEVKVDRAGRDELHLTQTQVLLANIHAGRAGSGSAASATMTAKGDKADTKVTVSATTFKGLDLAQIIHLATGPRTDEQAIRPLCDELVASAISVVGAAGEHQPLTVATIHATALKGRPLRAPAPKDVPQTEASRALVDDLSHSFAADLVEISDVAIAPATGAPASDLRSFGLKHATLTGFGDGKLARFTLADLALDTKAGLFKTAAAQIEGIGSSGGAVPSMNRIDLSDVAIDVPADDDKPDVRIAFAVAHAAYEAPGLVIGKLPPTAALVVEHVAFDVPPTNAAAPVLLAMGYKHLDISGAVNSHYDAATQMLAIDRFSLSDAAMGVMDLKLGLAGVSEAIVSQDDEAQKAAMSTIILKTADLTLRNAGLIDKAIAFKAAVDGIGLEQERTNIVQLIDTGLVGFGLQGSAKAQAVVAALHTFVVTPKTLHIAIASKEGLGAGSAALMGDPQALLDTLDVQASADHPSVP